MRMNRLARISKRIQVHADSPAGAPFEVDGHDLRVSASIGIALYPQDGDDADELIKKADRAMYAAKERGRNHFLFWGGLKGH